MGDVLLKDNQLYVIAMCGFEKISLTTTLKWIIFSYRKENIFGGGMDAKPFYTMQNSVDYMKGHSE